MRKKNTLISTVFFFSGDSDLRFCDVRFFVFLCVEALSHYMKIGFSLRTITAQTRSYKKKLRSRLPTKKKHSTHCRDG